MQILLHHSKLTKQSEELLRKDLVEDNDQEQTVEKFLMSKSTMQSQPVYNSDGDSNTCVTNYHEQ